MMCYIYAQRLVRYRIFVWRSQLILWPLLNLLRFVINVRNKCITSSLGEWRSSYNDNHKFLVHQLSCWESSLISCTSMAMTKRVRKREPSLSRTLSNLRLLGLVPLNPIVWCYVCYYVWHYVWLNVVINKVSLLLLSKTLKSYCMMLCMLLCMTLCMT